MTSDWELPADWDRMPDVEQPIGWRVAIQPASSRPFDTAFRPKSQRTAVFAAKQEAEREKERQRAHHRDIEAVFASGARPGFPAKGRRRK